MCGPIFRSVCVTIVRSRHDLSRSYHDNPPSFQVLLSQPTAAVSLTVSQTLDNRAGQSSPNVTLTPATLLFQPGNWNKAQLVEVRRRR